MEFEVNSPLVQEVLDQMPFGVALHSLKEGFPILYRNRQYAEQIGIELSFAREEKLVEVAERVVKTLVGGHTEFDIPGPDGIKLTRNWIITPIFDEQGELTRIVSIVEDLNPSLRARRRIESAVVQGMKLTLNIAQLADAHKDIGDFLSGVETSLTETLKADRVGFRSYDPEQRVLIRRVGDPESPLATLPCNPDKADLLSQVVFARRVFRGKVDLSSFEFRHYAQLVDLSSVEGNKVIFVPWRAGTETMGIVLAQRSPEQEDFTYEEGIVLMAAGHTTGLVCQRKRVELTLEERAKELESLEEIKSSFLRLAAHELRGPLALLNGYISMLSDEKLPPEEHPHIRAILQRAVHRIGLIVTQLTDATQLDENKLRLERRKVDLREVISNAVDSVLPIWSGERAKDFKLILPDNAVVAWVDAFRIGTIVQNLLDNAFKYSSPGDYVQCELRVEPESIMVTVQDQGIGINAEESEQLFQRFGRVANARNSHISGIGMGLFLSQEMARMHGGEIKVSSVEGEGSQFDLVLPIDGS